MSTVVFSASYSAMAADQNVAIGKMLEDRDIQKVVKEWINECRSVESYPQKLTLIPLQNSWDHMFSPESSIAKLSTMHYMQLDNLLKIIYNLCSNKDKSFKREIVQIAKKYIYGSDSKSAIERWTKIAEDVKNEQNRSEYYDFFRSIDNAYGIPKDFFTEFDENTTSLSNADAADKIYQYLQKKINEYLKVLLINMISKEIKVNGIFDPKNDDQVKKLVAGKLNLEYGKNVDIGETINANFNRYGEHNNYSGQQGIIASCGALGNNQLRNIIQAARNMSSAKSTQVKKNYVEEQKKLFGNVFYKNWLDCIKKECDTVRPEFQEYAKHLKNLTNVFGIKDKLFADFENFRPTNDNEFFEKMYDWLKINESYLVKCIKDNLTKRDILKIKYGYEIPYEVAPKKTKTQVNQERMLNDKKEAARKEKDHQEELKRQQQEAAFQKELNNAIGHSSRSSSYSKALAQPKFLQNKQSISKSNNAPYQSPVRTNSVPAKLPPKKVPIQRALTKTKPFVAPKPALTQQQVAPKSHQPQQLVRHNSVLAKLPVKLAPNQVLKAKSAPVKAPQAVKPVVAPKAHQPQQLVRPNSVPAKLAPKPVVVAKAPANGQHTVKPLLSRQPAAQVRKPAIKTQAQVRPQSSIKMSHAIQKTVASATKVKNPQ